MHLADLSSSLFAALGLRGVDNSLQLEPADRICLILVDGLGEISLSEHLSASPEKYRALSSLKSLSSLTSHFPTTTATNLASLGTGLFPSAHAMLGYTVRVPYSDGRILNALKWDERVDPYMWQSQSTLFERAALQGIEGSHIAEKRYEDSGFTRATMRGAKYRGANRADELISQAKIAHKASQTLSYIYVNWLDHAGHSDGVGSAKWVAALESINALVDGLTNSLPSGTAIYLTADHGMVNVGEKIIIGKGNNLAEGLTTIAGEARARHLYVEPGKIADVRSRWEEHLHDQVDLFEKRDALELFASQGATDLASAVTERMGDIVAVPRGSLVLLDPAIAEKEVSMVGHHGALTELERAIPLRHIAL